MKDWMYTVTILLAVCLLSGCSAPATPKPHGADLVLTESADKTSVGVGEHITFTITLTNRGPNAASEVVFGDALPDVLKVVSASCPTGSVTARAFCELDHLASGESAVDTVVATPVPDPVQDQMSFTTKALIAEFLAFDPDRNNNRASVPVQILLKPVKSAP